VIDLNNKDKLNSLIYYTNNVLDWFGDKDLGIIGIEFNRFEGPRIQVTDKFFEIFNDYNDYCVSERNCEHYPYKCAYYYKDIEFFTILSTEEFNHYIKKEELI